MDDGNAKTLVWIIDSPRSPLAGCLYAFENTAEFRYFSHGDQLPDGEERPDAIFFSAEIDGGPNGTAFVALTEFAAGIPLLACAKVRSLAQAVAFFRAGAVDYLSIPLEAEEVAERLSAALAKAAANASPTVMVELEALDDEPVTLTVRESDDRDLSAPKEADSGAAEPAGDEDDEPVAVDGLPIPTLWEELPCGLLVFDSAGNLVFSNALGLELFGFASLVELQDALENRRSSFNARGTNKKSLPDNRWPHVDAIKSRAARHAAVSIERPDGRRSWIRMDCLPHLYDGAISRVTMTLVNMTGELPDMR